MSINSNCRYLILELTGILGTVMGIGAIAMAWVFLGMPDADGLSLALFIVSALVLTATSIFSFLIAIQSHITLLRLEDKHKNGHTNRRNN